MRQRLEIITYPCAARRLSYAGPRDICGRDETVEYGPDLWLCQHHAQRLDEWLVRRREWENAEREKEWAATLQRRASEEAEAVARSVVYFVERDTFIKIGTTTRLIERIRALGSPDRATARPDGMSVGPVRLLATCPGTRVNERYFHDRFANDRFPGTEWFYPADELLALIRGLKGYRGTD